MADAETTEEKSFDRVEYWDSFYAEDGDDLDFYEWYSAEWLSEFITSELQKGDAACALDVGCGTSPVLFEVARSLQNESSADHDRLFGVDFAEEAIAFMKRVAADEDLRIEFEVMDVSKGLTGIDDTSFDVVVDKGCLDCFITGSGESAVSRYLGELERVLKPNGSLMLVAVNFSDIEHLLETGEIRADRFASGVRADSARALEEQKKGNQKDEGNRGSNSGLRVHKVIAYQQKHLYVCQIGVVPTLAVECGVCGQDLSQSYPELEEHCHCGNLLRRFALS